MNVTQHDRLLRLRTRVTDAFEGTVRPPANQIALHQCEECAALRAAFADVDWHRVPDELIEAHHGSLPLFSAEALAYFLPAYLLYALGHFTPDSLAAEMTVYTLTPDPQDEDREDIAEWKAGKLKYFTRDQIDAVSEFLEAVRDDAAFREYLGDVEPGRQRLLRLWARRWES